MHNGNPKLVASDKTCAECKLVFKNIVETWAEHNLNFYLCSICSARLEKERKESKAEHVKQRFEDFAANRDFIAEDCGWIKNSAGEWRNEFLNQNTASHPINIDSAENLKKYLPEGWIMRYDHEDIMAYDSRVNTDMPIMIRYMNNPRYFYSLVTDYEGLMTGETFDECLIHDMLKMIVAIRKMERQENNT